MASITDQENGLEGLNEDAAALDVEELEEQKELTIDNIRHMKVGLEKNIKDLREALAEEISGKYEHSPESDELVDEIKLALDQSIVLLERIVRIEDAYKVAIKSDTLLSSDIIELSEQLGFRVPLHLKKHLDDYDESDLEETNGIDELLPETEGTNLSFVSFDELEKYLQEPLPTITEPLKEEVSPRSKQEPESPVEGSPKTPFKTLREKEIQKEYIKSSLNISKVSFSSPTSTSSVLASPPLERDEMKDDVEYVDEEENKEFLTEEQQQLIEEQDVDQLLEQLKEYTGVFGTDNPEETSIHGTPKKEIVEHSKEDSPLAKTVTPGLPLPTTRDAPSSGKTHNTVTTPLKDTPTLDTTDTTGLMEVQSLKHQVELLSHQLAEKDKEYSQLTQSFEDLKQTHNDNQKEFLMLKDREEKMNSIATSLGDHLEHLQETVEKLKKERESKSLKQSEQLQSIIETLIKKENHLLETLVEQLEGEMKNRKVILDEEMLQLKKLIIETLGEDEEGSEQFHPEEHQRMIIELEALENDCDVTYYPDDPEDPVDVAVANTLHSLNCPVQIDIERIGGGDYFCDKRITVKLGPKGEALVRNGANFITLSAYLKRLYAPFFATERQEVPDAREEESQLHTASTPSYMTPQVNNHTEILRQPKSFQHVTQHNTPPTKVSPKEGPTVPKDSRGGTPESRPSSAPPNTRYISILQKAEKNNRLKSLKPAPQIRRPPPNSMSFDRRNSPLPPNYVLHNNNLMFVKQALGASEEQGFQSNHSIGVKPQKKPAVHPERKTKPTSASANNSRSTTPKGNMLGGSVDLNDPKQLAKLKRQALRMQIQQFSNKPLH